MTIINRLLQTIRGVTNEALDAVSDPARDSRQIVRDLEDQIAQAENSMLDVRAEYELLLGKIRTAQADVTKWSDAAKRAVAAGDDTLARECLEKKRDAADLLSSLTAQEEALKPSIDQTEEEIAHLRRKKTEMEHKSDMIAVRSTVADAKSTAATIISGINPDGVVASFDKIEEGVAKKEARANAAAHLADSRTGKSLEDRVAALGASSVDDELASMKASMGK